MRVGLALGMIVSSALVLHCRIAAGNPAGPQPQDPRGPDESRTVEVGDLGKRIVELARNAEAAGFSGAVLAAKGGKVIAAVGVGSADPDGKIPNTPATLFEIASATKPFTAVAILRLVQDGKVKLDDPIAKHLPGVPEDCKGITVRHLLQHTSGIPGANSQGAGTDLARVLPFFLRGGPQRPPGTKWEYWNQGYSLASEVIARASKQSYVRFCKESIFAPAKMDSTRFTGDKPPAGTTVAVGQSVRGAARSALEHPYGKEYGYQYRGMGGLVTSVWDLWRWDRALRGVDLLSEASKAEMFKPGPGDYGLGWFVRKNAQGKLVQFHSGGVRGFNADVRRYPDDDACLFVLSNRDDGSLHAVSQGVEQLLFGGRPSADGTPGGRPSVKGAAPLDAKLAKAIAGRYKDQRGAILTIAQSGKAVTVRIDWYANGPVTRCTLGLDAKGEVNLVESTGMTKIDVEREENGAVNNISIGNRKYVRQRAAASRPK